MNEDKLAAIDQKLNLVLILMQGNPLSTTDKGITGIIAGQEVRIKKMEDDHKKVAYTFAGMCAMAGYAGYKLLAVIFASIK